MDIAVFGGGCFWCTEAIFKSLRGVISVLPGYAGGRIENPTYEHVSTGTTGHAEVTRIEFDPAQISFEDLLTVFFATHDPTSLNKQGNDVGTQYRSVIFFTTDVQKISALKEISLLQKELDRPIVTEVQQLDVFYEAEFYHKDYYTNHSEESYCRLVIDPKLKKLHEKFQALLKNE